MIKAPLEKEKDYYYPRAKLFFISTNLLIVLYLFFNNNYFREVFFIGVVPYLLIINNEKCLYSKFCLSLILFKYFFMILFWPKVMFSDINIDPTHDCEDFRFAHELNSEVVPHKEDSASDKEEC